MSARPSVFDSIAPAQPPVGLRSGLSALSLRLAPLPPPGIEQRLAMAMRRSALALIECNARGEVTSWNAAARRLFGIEPSDAVHRGLPALLGETVGSAFVRRWEAALNGQPFDGLLAMSGASPGAALSTSPRELLWFITPVHDAPAPDGADAALLGLSCVVLDPAAYTSGQQAPGAAAPAEDEAGSRRAEIADYEQRLHELAHFDSLTRLPNRVLLAQRFRDGAAEARRRGYSVGLLMLDLDRFKHINDSLGHAAGDELLKQASRRLTEALRDYDTVARLGGDEFAAIVPDLRGPSDIAVVAGKVAQAFAEPFVLGDRELVLTASMGTALFPEDGQDIEQLLQFADAALYHAKERGRNNLQPYSRELTARASERLELESELRKALERRELELYYQPKFELRGARLVGAEALMRWNHPQRGLVPPDRFIGIAEDTGLIVPMGEWALATACAAARDWNGARLAAGLPPLKIAVNLSPRQFSAPGFVETVCRTLQETACEPHWIELEITESLLLDARANVRAMLESLSATGMTIAIDDFGTGYSALSYLTSFPVQTLKIDRSFVRGLAQDNGSDELVKAIVSLGSSLQMAMVAEGVETTGQAARLQALGCHMAQGFLYAKPLPRAAFDALVAAAQLSTASESAQATQGST